jgi:hypothetical protein
MELLVGNNGRKGAVMIKWADKLYLSEDINLRKKKKLIKSIEESKLTFEIYCITFASNPDNLFDIINVNDFLFPYYKKQNLYILGIATSRGEAKNLVKIMIEEIYQKTGGFLVREYFG